MKILHLLDEPWDSGITAYALQTAELLHKAGHAVVVGVIKGKKPETLAAEKGLKTAPIVSLADLWRLLHNTDWDLVNSHTGRSHTWSVMNNIATGRKYPVVRTRGDARPLRVNALSRFIYRHTAGVISASDHIGRQYEQEIPMPEGRMDTVYPSVQKTEAPPPSQNNVIGILGRLDPVKGHSILLEAAVTVLDEFPKARFRVAGREAGVSISILRNQAKTLGVDNAVEFLGFQDSAMLFMSSCSIGVISSIGSEEISRACLEWMAVGRPVVGTLVGCLPELIEPGETGLLVPPGDGAALGQALVTLLKEISLRDQYGLAGRHLVERRFSPEIQLQRTLSVYQNAIAWSRRSLG